MFPSSQPAALLVHGLGGTEYDLGNLGRHLSDAGIVTRIPLLPGHGGKPEDLLGIGHEAWIATVTAAYRELRRKHRVVHLAGFCLGALIALEVAKREQHRDRLVLLSPPLFLDGWSLPRNKFLRHVVYRMGSLADRMRLPEAEPFGIKNERVRGLIRARFSRGDGFHYPYVPLSSIRTVDELRTKIKKNLGRLDCDTLIVHAREDEVTSLRSARYIAGHLGGHVDLLELNDSYHMIMVDNERQRVLERTQRFLCAGGARPAAPSPQAHWVDSALAV
ncbi:alpha/beta hydrolase [Paludibacterium yongneupense]|uniref:alpha/beta hydrolase n=1 Tax=Paludibacterium yongneupense TaxID=400061 RepID=UPI0004256CBA|nr:alpha/beta fold hydrolase [Paludibacterium yongneupense]